MLTNGNEKIKKFKRANLIEKLSLKTDFVHTVQKEKHGNQAEHQVKEEVLNLLLNSLTTKFLAQAGVFSVMLLSGFLSCGIF